MRCLQVVQADLQGSGQPRRLLQAEVHALAHVLGVSCHGAERAAASNTERCLGGERRGQWNWVVLCPLVLQGGFAGCSRCGQVGAHQTVHDLGVQRHLRHRYPWVVLHASRNFYPKYPCLCLSFSVHAERCLRPSSHCMLTPELPIDLVLTSLHNCTSSVLLKISSLSPAGGDVVAMREGGWPQRIFQTINREYSSRFKKKNNLFHEQDEETLKWWGSMRLRTKTSGGKPIDWPRGGFTNSGNTFHPTEP